jgi:hypothetical protein
MHCALNNFAELLNDSGLDDEFSILDHRLLQRLCKPAKRVSDTHL